MPADNPGAGIKERYLAYLNSPEFRPVAKRLAGTPYGRYVVAFVTFMTTIGIPIAIYQVVQIVRHRKVWRARRVEVARRSVPVMTYPLMVNSGLRGQPGAIAPGLVLGSFDPAANKTTEFLVGVVEEVFRVSQEGATTPDEAVLEQLMGDEAFVPHRRRLLPTGLTAGKPVYAFDLMILFDFLPDPDLEIPLIPCLAEPGAHGEIHQVPWWLVPGSAEAQGQAG